jgi:hypothetical protein
MGTQKYQMTAYLNAKIEKEFAGATRSFNAAAYIRQLIKLDLKKAKKDQVFTKFNDGTAKRVYGKDEED